MKIENEVLEVTRSGQFVERGFAIANNSKAFDILSSKIYTDIPLAIVRELSTNASDSHTDAGYPERPFDVHLPNSLEPWLTIRDYGTGLSPENVESVYTTYFRSTRSGSNDFTGCLGLGSKSPFAYTDQFTIVSNWGGRKFTYSAFKNEHSCPSLALLSEVETDEINGLEIRIAIKQNDLRYFVNAAEQIYEHFNVRPNISGASVNFKIDDPIISTSEYRLYNDNTYGVNKIRIVMGQVCYNVDDRKIIHRLASYGKIVLYMPIGSCSIAASREEIHYDERTIGNVQSLMNIAMEHAAKEFEKLVADEATLLLKLRKLNKYGNTINGLSVNGAVRIYGKEDGKYSIKICSFHHRGNKLYISDYHNSFNGQEGDIIFIEEDVEITQALKNRLRAYMQNHNNSRVCLAKIQDRSYFELIFGNITTKLSLLPQVPRAPRDNSRASLRSKPIKLLSDISSDSMGLEWENIENYSDIDTTDACCVPRDGNWAIWRGHKVKPQHVREIAKMAGFKRVYGIAEKRYDSMRVKYNLIELSAVAKNKIQTIIDGLDTYSLARYHHGGIDRMSNMHLKSLAGISTECDDFIKLMSADVSRMNLHDRMCEIFDIKMPTAPDYGDAFLKKYPILLAIDWYSGKITMNAIVQYVKMVEASNP